MASRLVALIGGLALGGLAVAPHAQSVAAGSDRWAGIANALGRTGPARHVERRNVDAAAASGEIREQSRPHARGSG